MPTVSDNKYRWTGEYDWKNRGDEWSEAWGGPFMHWYGALLPRIKAHLPAHRILEIACGYGRWTNYLKDLCDHLTILDLSDECVAACRERFSACDHIEYHVNDGKSLAMIPDASIDFIFSFDSLVHADLTVIEAYLSQWARILTKEGVAFIHHSNLAEYQTSYERIRRVPKLEKLLVRLGVLDESLHWRDGTVDAEKVEAAAAKHDLQCISQEIILWGTRRTFIDCISTIVRSDSPLKLPNRKFRNAAFMVEANNLAALSRLYSPEYKVHV